MQYHLLRRILFVDGLNISLWNIQLLLLIPIELFKLGVLSEYILEDADGANIMCRAKRNLSKKGYIYMIQLKIINENIEFNNDDVAASIEQIHEKTWTLQNEETRNNFLDFVNTHTLNGDILWEKDSLMCSIKMKQPYVPITLVVSDDKIQLNVYQAMAYDDRQILDVSNYEFSKILLEMLN